MQTFARRAMVGLKELRLPLGTVVLHGRAVVITINDFFAAGQRVTENPRVELYLGGTLNPHTDRSCATGESPFPGNIEINHDRTWAPCNLCGHTRRFSRTANTVSEEPYYGMQLRVDWAAAPAVFTAGVCLPLPQLELSRNSLSQAGEGLIYKPADVERWFGEPPSNATR